MSDEKTEKGEGETAVAEAPRAKGSKKPVIIVCAVVGLLVLAGVPVVILNSKSKVDVAEGVAVEISKSELHPVGHGSDGAPEDLELEEGEEALGAFAPVDPFVVNLRGGRFLRLQFQVEFSEREIPSRWTARSPLLRDAVVALLVRKRAEDILGDDGLPALKRDLRDVANEILKKELVKDVLLTQVVVQ